MPIPFDTARNNQGNTSSGIGDLAFKLALQREGQDVARGVAKTKSQVDLRELILDLQNKKDIALSSSLKLGDFPMQDRLSIYENREVDPSRLSALDAIAKSTSQAKLGKTVAETRKIGVESGKQQDFIQEIIANAGLQGDAKNLQPLSIREALADDLQGTITHETSQTVFNERTIHKRENKE